MIASKKCWFLTMTCSLTQSTIFHSWKVLEGHPSVPWVVTLQCVVISIKILILSITKIIIIITTKLKMTRHGWFYPNLADACMAYNVILVIVPKLLLSYYDIISCILYHSHQHGMHAFVSGCPGQHSSMKNLHPQAMNWLHRCKLHCTLFQKQNLHQSINFPRVIQLI